MTTVEVLRRVRAQLEEIIGNELPSSIWQDVDELWDRIIKEREAEA